MTSWDLYWLTRLDSLNCLFNFWWGCSLILAVISAIVCGISSAESYSEDEKYERTSKKAKRLSIKALFISVTGMVFATITPNTKEMAAIILIPKVVNSVAANEKLKELPDNVLDLANAWLKELSPKEKK